MPIDPNLVAPDHTAIVLNECQRGVVGDLAFLPELVEAAAPAMANIGRLVRGGRAAGVQVIHNVAKGRADGKGGNHNARMFVISKRYREAGGPVTDPELFAQVVDEIGVEDEDILLSRIHGMSPMTDTGLDMILRNLGVTTVVVGGVSVNVGVTNLAMDAMNRSYNVVVARDCCAGVPVTYADDVMKNTLANIAWVLTTDQILDLWSKAG